jgi:hypothetical protein
MTDLFIYGPPVSPPAFSGQASEVETARRTYQEILPRHFDYLEGMLAVGFVDNLTSCRKMFGRLVPEKVDLS